MTLTIVELLIGFIESACFYIIIDTFMHKRENFPKCFYFLGFLMLGIVIDMSFYFYFGTIQNTLIMYFVAFLFSLLFKGSIKNKVLIPIIGITINGCCELVVLYLLGLIFNVSTPMLVNDKLLWIVGALSSKFIFLIGLYEKLKTFVTKILIL